MMATISKLTSSNKMNRKSCEKALHTCTYHSDCGPKLTDFVFNCRYPENGKNYDKINDNAGFNQTTLRESESNLNKTEIDTLLSIGTHTFTCSDTTCKQSLQTLVQIVKNMDPEKTEYVQYGKNLIDSCCNTTDCISPLSESFYFSRCWNRYRRSVQKIDEKSYEINGMLPDCNQVFKLCNANNISRPERYLNGYDAFQNGKQVWRCREAHKNYSLACLGYKNDRNGKCLKTASSEEIQSVQK